MKSKFRKRHIETVIKLKDNIALTESSIELDNSYQGSQTFGFTTNTPNVAMKSTHQLFASQPSGSLTAKNKIQQLEEQIKRVKKSVFYDASMTNMSKFSQSRASFINERGNKFGSK